MFKDSHEGQTQYEPAALEPVAKAAAGFEQHETGYVTALAPMKFRDLLYSAATVERLVQERDDFAQQLLYSEQGRRNVSEKLAASQAREQQLREIAELIGTIFVHGSFIAETFNEKRLEQCLRNVGCFWETLQQFDNRVPYKQDDELEHSIN